MNTGDMPVTTEFLPTGNGQTYRSVNSSLGLSLARRLTENFSFGITGRWVHEGIAGIKTNNGVFDFGFQYNVGLARTKFAVDIANFGFSADPNGSISALSVLGRDTTFTDFQKISVPAVFRLGLATEVVKKETQSLFILAQLNHPTDNNETVNLGAEYVWRNTFMARTGYQFGQDESGLPSFGFGLKLKRRYGILNIDYGMQNKKYLGTVHKIGFGISF
jgi:hypothetical protein